MVEEPSHINKLTSNHAGKIGLWHLLLLFLIWPKVEVTCFSLPHRLEGARLIWILWRQ